jgi:hypothetical protein
LALSLLKGEFKKAIEFLKGNPDIKDFENLFHLNKLVLEYYKKHIGEEVTLPIRGKTQTGVLKKIKGSTIYIEIKKTKITATWPVKVKKMPIDFKFNLIEIPDYLKNIYLGAKEFKRKNYAAAKYYFVKTGKYAFPLLEAADKESKYIMALAGACIKGNSEEVKNLLKKGADVNGEIVAYIKDEKTGEFKKHVSTPLIESIKSQKNNIIKLLVKNGADVNKGNQKKVTPLMFAIMYFPQEIEEVEFLLKNGANIDAVDNDGNTPLCGAVAAGRPGAIKLLLKHGAEVNAPNKKGLTPIMLAVVTNKPSIFKQLSDAGADLYKRHPDGWNIFNLNRSRMDPELKQMLDKISPPKSNNISPSFPSFSGNLKTQQNFAPMRQ